MNLKDLILKGLMMCMKTDYQVTEHLGEKCIVRIHKPILSEEERKKREENIKTALVRFYKETRSK